MAVKPQTAKEIPSRGWRNGAVPRASTCTRALLLTNHPCGPRVACIADQVWLLWLLGACTLLLRKNLLPRCSFLNALCPQVSQSVFSQFWISFSGSAPVQRGLKISTTWGSQGCHFSLTCVSTSPYLLWTFLFYELRCSCSSEQRMVLCVYEAGIT